MTPTVLMAPFNSFLEISWMTQHQLNLQVFQSWTSSLVIKLDLDPEVQYF